MQRRAIFSCSNKNDTLTVRKVRTITTHHRPSSKSVVIISQMNWYGRPKRQEILARYPVQLSQTQGAIPSAQSRSKTSIFLLSVESG